MSRIYNFSAGPSMLPLEVLEQAAAEMTDYNGSGMSVMEMSHRSPVYDAIIKQTEADFRTLMNIPDNYKVLFLQGGASTQFAAVPLNLMVTGKADYVVSGQFSGKAFKEAKKYGDAKCIATSEDKTFSYIPEITPDMVRPDADYVHVCYNNTIFGTKFPEVPNVGDKVLVADMSSCITSEPVDVTKFGVIYAGAQKNMAPAGLTVVIVRRDLAGREMDICPSVMSYDTLIKKDSMLNTPPCWCIYMLGLMLDWLESVGGVCQMQSIKRERAQLIYDVLDNSRLYIPHARPDSRSDMNVTFRTGSEELDAQFVKGAAAQGLLNLKGHRLTGGIRASLYNAMPMEGARALAEYMKKFEVEHNV